MPTLPTHVAVIPDGNRRWARERGMAPVEGHRASYEKVFELAEVVARRGVRYLTFYAFSTENWHRAQEEVGFLNSLLERFLKGEMLKLHDKGFRIRFFGSREGLEADLVKGMERVEEHTGANTGMTLNICFNYGGRLDLLEAVRQIVREGVVAEEIDESVIEAHLSTRDTPPPDLILRTSGEQRLSNYLLWEAAYAELIFLPLYWPEVGETEIDEVLQEYDRRARRYGK